MRCASIIAWGKCQKPQAFWPTDENRGSDTPADHEEIHFCLPWLQEPSLASSSAADPHQLNLEPPSDSLGHLGDQKTLKLLNVKYNFFEFQSWEQIDIYGLICLRRITISPGLNSPFQNPNTNKNDTVECSPTNPGNEQLPLIISNKYILEWSTV